MQARQAEAELGARQAAGFGSAELVEIVVAMVDHELPGHIEAAADLDGREIATRRVQVVYRQENRVAPEFQL